VGSTLKRALLSLSCMGCTSRGGQQLRNPCSSFRVPPRPAHEPGDVDCKPVDHAPDSATRPLVAQSTLRCWVKSAWCRSRGATRGYWKRTITRRANPPCQGGMRVTGPSRLKLDMRRWDGRGRGMRSLHPGTLRRWVSKPLCTQQGLLCSPLAHGPVDMPNDLPRALLR
jgi:hypothetical protein